MKLDANNFRHLRRLAPVLDDILSAGEIEHVEQAMNLAALARLCSQLFDAYHHGSAHERSKARPDGSEAQ